MIEKKRMDAGRGMHQLNFNNRPILLAEENQLVSLFDLVDRYRRSSILLPDHQRDFVWEEKKRDKWIERLRGGRRPIGVIVTYQIDDGSGDSPIWINDGSQRIRTTAMYLDQPERYGDSQDTAEKVVRSYSMPTQHRNYQNHTEALEDFQEINIGTSLTALEYHKGILSYIDGYSVRLKPIFDLVEDTIVRGEARITKRRGGRETKHKYLRDKYALIYRYVSEDKELSDYGIGTKRLDEKNPIEKRISDLVSETGADKLNMDSARKLIGQIERDTATIETIWRRIESARGISNNSYHFLLHCGIYRYNTGVPGHVWEDFLFKILDNSKGLTAVINPSNVRDRKFLTLGGISGVSHICKILDSSFADFKKKRRSKNGQVGIDMAGYDSSHILPFSVFGNGDTISEPASLNRARGAKPISGGGVDPVA